MRLLILEREEGVGREREREREHRCERETSIGCLLYVPWLGIEPTTQACALTGNRIHNLMVYGMVFQPNEPSSQGIGHVSFSPLVILASFWSDGTCSVFIQESQRSSLVPSPQLPSSRARDCNLLTRITSPCYVNINNISWKITPSPQPSTACFFYFCKSLQCSAS